MLTESNRASQRRSLWRLAPGIERFSALYLAAGFVLVFGAMRPELFLTVNTLQLVVTQGAVTAVLALAFLIPLTTDTFDISVGQMLSLTIVLMNWLTIKTEWPVGVVALMVLVICACVGFINGFLVVRWKVDSLIATLGMFELLIGAQLLISDNQQLAANFSTTFTKLGNGSVWNVPYLAIYMLLIAVVLWFVLEQTPVGRRMFAIGGNREAARLAGIRADRTIWLTLIASAVVAGIAGIMYTAYVGPYSGDVGAGFLFPALAAVFFGASQLKKRPNVWGTLIAYFCLAFGIQGFSLVSGPGAFWVSPFFQGAALILAVAAATMRGAVASNDGSGGSAKDKGRKRDLGESSSSAQELSAAQVG